MIDDHDEQVLICTRIADMPGPPVMSSIEHCAKCNARVWRAETSPQHMTIWCSDCFHPTEDDTVLITRETLLQAIAYFAQQHKDSTKP